MGMLALLAAGPVAALSNPNSFCIGDPCVISADKDVDPGAVLDFGTRTVVLQKQLDMLPLPSGALSTLTIRCGTFRITGDGMVKGDLSTGPAGTVTIEAVDNIELNGTTSLGDFKLTGQDGGSLTLRTSVGSVTGNGRINLGADGIIASGGTLTVVSAADIVLGGTISLPGGSQGSGGTLEMQAPGQITLSGLLDLTGGQGGGGYLDVTAAGALTINNLDLTGSSEFGDAGLATIDGGSVTIGTLRGLGSADVNCGDGADIDIFSGGDMLINGPVDIRARGVDCSGGFLSLDGGRIFINGSLLMSGDGSDGDGGDLDVSATTLIQVASAAVIDLEGGTGGAGDILLQSDGDLVSAGVLKGNGRSSTSPGSTLVELDAGGTLTVSGSIDASGGSAAGVDSGGDLSLNGCKVATAATALVYANGDAGDIRVTANDKLTLRGIFQAGSGGISVQYGPRAVPPTVTASFSPPTTAVLNPLLVPCRICDTDADCTDGNQCTTDTCAPDGSACINTVHDGTCTDNNACTVGDTCVSGVCVPGPAPDCSDTSTCTIDGCLPSTGCIHFPIAGTCDDGNSCTSDDHCVIGVCMGTAANCDDHNVCTDDTCTDSGGCLHINNTSACSDNNPCTTNDGCFNGTCNGTPVTCDDGNPCTTDSCAQSAGCQHIAIPGCADTDGDGKLDDVDECTTIEWTSPPTTPPDQFPKSFGLIATKLSSPDGSQGLLIKGAFNVAPSALPIDPAANGVHIYAADAIGAIFDLSLPGGAGCAAGDGWTSGGPPTRTIWKYRNRSDALPPSCTPGSAQGVALVQIKDSRQSGKQALQFKAKAKSATLLRDPDLPLTRVQVDFALGAQPAPGVASAQARAGQCAEALFTGNPIPISPKPSCKTKLKNSALDGATCKGR